MKANKAEFMLKFNWAFYNNSVEEKFFEITLDPDLSFFILDILFE